jgi:hypothetical protein
LPGKRSEQGRKIRRNSTVAEVVCGFDACLICRDFSSPARFGKNFFLQRIFFDGLFNNLSVPIS